MDFQLQVFLGNFLYFFFRDSIDIIFAHGIPGVWAHFETRKVREVGSQNRYTFRLFHLPAGPGPRAPPHGPLLGQGFHRPKMGLWFPRAKSRPQGGPWTWRWRLVTFLVPPIFGPPPGPKNRKKKFFLASWEYGEFENRVKLASYFWVIFWGFFWKKSAKKRVFWVPWKI